MPRRNDSLSLAMARRLSLSAQGFLLPRDLPDVGVRQFRKVLDHIGLIQIDSVNVLARSQDLVLFSRLGTYPRSLIADMTARQELFEYWVHEASFVPVEQHHLHRHRMTKDHQWAGIRTIEDKRPGFVEYVYDRVRREGPLTAGDLKQRTGPKKTWWDWDDGKYALEWLFWTGRITATRREHDFARLYHVTSKVIPRQYLNVATPEERDARKELLVLAATYHGVGTMKDLADYHRQKPAEVRPLIPELVAEGRLQELTVEGWADPAYVVPGFRVPNKVDRTALLSPFDPVVWNRDRAARLFGFQYKIEIYTPAPRRKYGYYVLPILWNSQLVGRVDLKADRQRGVLMARGIFAEPDAPIDEIVPDLATELTRMAAWLELSEGVEVGDRGEFAEPLRAELGATG